jgi:hypothetical protein
MPILFCCAAAVAPVTCATLQCDGRTLLFPSHDLIARTLSSPDGVGFYVKCRPQGADAQQIALKHKCAFIGYPAWKNGAGYDRHAMRSCLLDISVPDSEWKLQELRSKNGDQRMILMTEHVFQILVRCVAGKKPEDRVFTRDDGSPVKDFRQAWWNACLRSNLGRFQCRDCESNVSEGRKCTTCNSNKKAKYIGLHFHDLRRTGIRNMSRKGVPEKVGMLISGHKTDSVYRRYNIVDMEVLKTATIKIEEHQREIVESENNHRTAIVSTKDGADDKTNRLN